MRSVCRWAVLRRMTFPTTNENKRWTYDSSEPPLNLRRIPGRRQWASSPSGLHHIRDSSLWTIAQNSKFCSRTPQPGDGHSRRTSRFVVQYVPEGTSSEFYWSLLARSGMPGLGRGKLLVTIRRGRGCSVWSFCAYITGMCNMGILEVPLSVGTIRTQGPLTSHPGGIHGSDNRSTTNAGVPRCIVHEFHSEIVLVFRYKPAATRIYLRAKHI